MTPKPKKREPIPEFGRDGLKEALTQWVKDQGPEAFKLGAYYSKVLRSRAVQGAGLLALAPFIRMICSHVPGGQLPPAWLTSSLEQLGAASPEVIEKQFCNA
jgi:hypothetical protein